MDRSPRVLLFGFGPTALSALESLLARVRVVGVVRELESQAEASDSVALLARSQHIPLYRDGSAAAVESLVAELRPDCVVISSYNRVLKPATLAYCRFVNVHYSPLPRYRGRANVNWALINDEPATAITLHVVAPGLDAGNILFQRPVAIGPRDTIGDLYGRLNEIQRECLAQTVVEHLNGYAGVPQDEAWASYGCTRLPDDGCIDWSALTRKVDCLIRGLSEPFPGAYTFLDGRRLTIWKAEPVWDPPLYEGRIPGRVVSVAKSAGQADVLTGDGILRLLEVELEGAGRVAASAVLDSLRMTLGLSASELIARLASLEQRLGSNHI